MKTVMHDCPDCGAESTMQQRWLRQQCTYGVADEVRYTAVVPVWQCSVCKAGYIDGRGMDIEHEALCKRLGVLAPREIRELRKRHGLSRKELGQLTGFGEASIKRWERGALIQNKSADKFLRLIDDADVLEKLRQLD